MSSGGTGTGQHFRKNRPFTITLVLLAALLIIGAAGYILFGRQIQAINTLTKLGDGLYYMEYVGDYGFSDFLKKGGASSDQEIVSFLSQFLTRGLYKFEAPVEIGGCSTIAAAALTSGYLFGGNFDWEECTALIVKTVPRDGYTSFSTANVGFLGASPEPRGLMEKFVYLGALYAPLDGMNEKGLCVAVLVVGNGEQTNQNTGKPGLTTTTAVRLLLDGAASVAEALELLGRYDMHASADLEYHLAIADATGRSVVVEYLDNVMHVSETPVVTNHFLHAGFPNGPDEHESTVQR